ncbi:hypothetical protein E2562_031205 [Oryza meyeriana var. granulata]|uniref:Uncharacterized protein n=1 Tax=Oryza meyeriana var. granulata TaxID=110450 RepID=A0A6G1DQA8_9ORYZ|nr:hypothetical protein E2562_031205 [Oryza meyeriana var. granulata]
MHWRWKECAHQGSNRKLVAAAVLAEAHRAAGRRRRCRRRCAIHHLRQRLDRGLVEPTGRLRHAAAAAHVYHHDVASRAPPLRAHVEQDGDCDDGSGADADEGDHQRHHHRVHMCLHAGDRELTNQTSGEGCA